MADTNNPDPRHRDPVYDDRLQARPSHLDPTPHLDPTLDPAARANDPLLADRPASGGRGGLIAAGIIAVLLVVAVVAFSSGTTTDPGTTAVIPDQTQDAAPATPAPDAAPMAPAPEATPQPLETAPAPAE